MNELWQLARSWYHERDRGYYIHPDGTEELLWDSGCHVLCHRCQLERVLRKLAAIDKLSEQA